MTMKSFTDAEQRVGRLMGRGWTYKRAATELGMSAKGITAHINRMADKLPNPEQLLPGTLVMLEFARRRWDDEAKAAEQADQADQGIAQP